MNSSSVRQELGNYFAWFDELGDEELPWAAIPDGATNEIFVGAAADGNTRWRPKPKEEYFDLSELEQNANLTIHSSIKELLNSWWFADLSVEHQGSEYQLDPVIPGNYKAQFLIKLLGYRGAHGGRIDYVPIGMDLHNGHLLVVKNDSGEIFSEDYQSGEYRRLAAGLTEFLAEGN